MLTYFFPGQGSQKKGMGGELFDEFPEYVSRADQVLGYSITQLCLEDPENQLNLTQFTQPALFVVNALTHLKRMKEEPGEPAFYAGHSLGEYNALLAAGAFDFETGLRLVQKRGQLMGEAKGGGMAAVIGLTEDKVREVLGQSGLTSIDIANFNSPRQIVLSGPTDEVLSLKPAFKEAGVRMYMPLKVSAAFHSRYMKPASDAFREFLGQFEFKSLSVPVISNVEARPYRDDQIADLLAAQIVSSVKWTESIRYLMGRGVTDFHEVGPGKVLAGLYKKIKAEAKPLILADEDGGQKKKVADTNPAPLSASSGRPEVAITSGPGQRLGNASFRQAYGLNYAYMAGGMHAGISSPAMVQRLARAGLLGSYGTSGLALKTVQAGIREIKTGMPAGVAFAVNLTNDFEQEGRDEALVDLFLNEDVTLVEAANYIQLTPALIRYRLQGARRHASGQIEVKNRIIAKATRPEVAKVFMSPAPEREVAKLLAAGKISQSEAALAPFLPMADDIIAQADGAWHTDQSGALSVLPSFQVLRDDLMQRHSYAHPIRLGAAGGMGTPQAVAAAFILGADFVVTGSINQATVEAATSAAVKELLCQINVQDTEYAPAGDLFELGGKVQVLKRGLFFPARANKLLDLYRHHESLDDMDEKTRQRLQERFFNRSFQDIWAELRQDTSREREIAIAERNPKAKMAMIFKWYFSHANRLALRGDKAQKVDYLVFCGPAMGSFNQWAKTRGLQHWSQRHVDEMAQMLMNEAARFLEKRIDIMGLGSR